MPSDSMYSVLDTYPTLPSKLLINQTIKILYKMFMNHDWIIHYSYHLHYYSFLDLFFNQFIDALIVANRLLVDEKKKTALSIQ